MHIYPSNMLKITLISALFIFYNAVLVTSENMLGEGVWDVIHVEPCGDGIDYKIKSEILMKKYNRSHNAFDAKFDVPDELDNTYTVKLDIYKCVDGGCKPYQVITQQLNDIIEKYAQKNFETIMTLADLDKTLPIKSGTHSIKNYVMNLCELPEKCMYGLFDTLVYLIKDNMNLYCLKVLVDFKDTENDQCKEKDE